MLVHNVIYIYRSITMIGELIKINKREVHDRKVTRVVVDIDEAQLRDATARDVDIEHFLLNNVGENIGFEIKALEDTEQSGIDD